MGLNCTLSYQDGTGATRQYRVRAGDIVHGVQMIATESEARTQRAYYPHRSAMEQFSVVVLLKNWDERSHFTNWLSNYAQYAIDPDIIQQTFPWMSVSIPSRQFLQQGVPLQGYQWGAHTGQMMFTPQVVFEAATSPGQTAARTPDISSVINKWSAFASDTAIQYFYPIGTQLSGDQTGTYTKIVYPGDPSQFNTAPPPPPNPVPTVPGPGPTPVA
jgi:hypothetical protein